MDDSCPRVLLPFFLFATTHHISKREPVQFSAVPPLGQLIADPCTTSRSFGQKICNLLIILGGGRCRWSISDTPTLNFFILCHLLAICDVGKFGK